MFIEEKVYNHMTKIAEQWWQMVIAEKNNTRQVISPSPRHEWMESRERDGLVVPFLGRLAPVRVTSPLFLLFLSSSLLPALLHTHFANSQTQRDQPPCPVIPSPARSSRTAAPPTRPDPNRRPDLGVAAGAPSHGPRRRPAALLRCEATRRRHPPPTQPPPRPPRHPSSAASSCSSPGPARSSSCPCS